MSVKSGPWMRRLLCVTAGLLIAGCVAVAGPPPAGRVEMVPPAPSAVVVWTPGYWVHGWGGWRWVPGRYVSPPWVGAVWVPDHWRQAHRGWRYIPGHWKSRRSVAATGVVQGQ
ncbi:MAG TPA: hypothetical protein VML36_03300 [Nitrospiria bacterium]|nr:hypothetical protein [Nitrospiria bacterium]